MFCNISWCFAQDCPPTKCSTTSTTPSIPHFSAHLWWCWFVWHLNPRPAMWYSTYRMQVEALEMDAPRCGEFFAAVCFMWRTYLGKMLWNQEIRRNPFKVNSVDFFLPKIAAGEALRVNHSPVRGRRYGEAAVVIVIVVASSRMTPSFSVQQVQVHLAEDSARPETRWCENEVASTCQGVSPQPDGNYEGVAPQKWGNSWCHHVIFYHTLWQGGGAHAFKRYGLGRSYALEGLMWRGVGGNNIKRVEGHVGMLRVLFFGGVVVVVVGSGGVLVVGLLVCSCSVLWRRAVWSR